MDCPFSLRDHIESTMLALLESGPSPSCEMSYQALIELAEMSRRMRGFAPYQAQLTDELIKVAEEGKKLLEEEEMMNMFANKKVASA